MSDGPSHGHKRAASAFPDNESMNKSLLKTPMQKDFSDNRSCNTPGLPVKTAKFSLNETNPAVTSSAPQSINQPPLKSVLKSVTGKIIKEENYDNLTIPELDKRLDALEIKLQAMERNRRTVFNKVGGKSQ